jgi:hypothetical protein
LSEILTFLLIVSAGDHDRMDCPVSFLCRLADLDVKAQEFPNVRLLLEEAGTQTVAEAQWDDQGDPKAENGRLVWTLAGKTPKGTERRFTLHVERGKTPGTGKATIGGKSEKYLDIANAGRPVLHYQCAQVAQFPDKPSKFDRACYFHPLWAPSGDVLTGDFHPDHAHHRGLWFAWVKAQAGPVNANFWEIQEGRGQIVNKGGAAIVGPVFAGLIATNECVSGDKVLLNETVTSRVYGLPADPWIVDLMVRQEATESDVVLGKMHYGGLGFRGRDEWNAKDAPLEILTSEGKTRRDAHGTPARWVEFSGPAPKGQWGGLLLIEHPTNPRYPNRLRVHPTMPFLSTTLVVAEPYTIKRGEPLVLKYRIVLHNGKLGKEEAERFAADFASPPSVTLKRGE